MVNRDAGRSIMLVWFTSCKGVAPMGLMVSYSAANDDE